MATPPIKHHRPPPSGSKGRDFVSPLGGQSNAPRTLRGGGSSGPFVTRTFEEARKPEKPVSRPRGNTVPLT
jgi:hypothetical protein